MTTPWFCADVHLRVKGTPVLLTIAVPPGPDQRERAKRCAFLTVAAHFTRRST